MAQDVYKDIGQHGIHYSSEVKGYHASLCKSSSGKQIPMAVNYERHIVLRKETITTLAQTMLGILTRMITLRHMDSKFMATLTAGAARLCGCDSLKTHDMTQLK